MARVARGAPELLELLARRHGAGLHGGAGQDDRLGDLGQRQLRLRRAAAAAKAGHARADLIGNAQPIEAAHLLGDGAIDRGIAGMDAGDILALCMGRRHLGDDLVEVHGGGVEDAGAGRGRGDDLRRHQRAGIEADRAALDQAHGRAA